VVSEVMSRSVEAPPADPDAPGAFRFAEPGKLASILIEVGALDVRERFLDFHIEAPISTDEFWELRSATSATLREKLADLSKEQTVQIAREVREAALEFFPNGYMSFPARMNIVTARKR